MSLKKITFPFGRENVKDHSVGSTDGDYRKV